MVTLSSTRTALWKIAASLWSWVALRYQGFHCKDKPFWQSLRVFEGQETPDFVEVFAIFPGCVGLHESDAAVQHGLSLWHWMVCLLARWTHTQSAVLVGGWDELLRMILFTFGSFGSFGWFGGSQDSETDLKAEKYSRYSMIVEDNTLNGDLYLIRYRIKHLKNSSIFNDLKHP